MSDVRIVDRLENWFDALVVLADPQGRLSGAALTIVAEFAARRTVYVVREDGPPGPCRLERSGPGAAWDVRCPAGDTLAQAQSLWTFLRGAGARRPLIWVEHPAYGHFLERAGEAFKVFHAAPKPRNMADKVLGLIGKASSAGAPAAVVGACDVLVAADQAAAETAQAGADFRGTRVVWSGGYAALDAAICQVVNAMLAADKALNILVLYDDAYTHIKAVQEHLQAFGAHSRHHYAYFAAQPGETFADYADDWPDAWRLEDYDAVVWHYCLRAAHAENMEPLVAAKLAAYDGLKILFIQDDYENTATTWRSIEQAGIHLVMTCVPADGLAYAFPQWKPGVVEFLQTHTGFVPEDDMDRFAVPMAARKLHLAYRARTLAYSYGTLGREKMIIGQSMKALAEQRGVPVDIAGDEASRIYGDDWYRFTASARATLATETGSHVFDFDGSLAVLAKQAAADGMSYEDFYARHLVGMEDHVRMNQVSPRIFEAIRLRTALVCFEGEYSGAIEPHVHYIPLKKDFSNADEVFEKLKDVPFLEAMTERAYRDVIQSGRWSQASFVRRFDAIVQSRVMRPARSEFMAAPVAVRRRGHSGVDVIARRTPFEYALNTAVLRPPMRREALAASVDNPLLRHQPATPPADARVIWTTGSEALKVNDYWRGAGAGLQPAEGGLRLTTPPIGLHYAANIDIDFKDVWFEHEYCWIVATLRDVVGEIGLSVFNPEDDTIHFEQFVSGPGDQTVVLPIPSAAGEWLMFRTGGSDAAAQATFVEARIYAAFRYAPKVIEAMRGLVRHPHFKAILDAEDDPPG